MEKVIFVSTFGRWQCWADLEYLDLFVHDLYLDYLYFLNIVSSVVWLTIYI